MLWGLVAGWSDGTELAYNPTYTRGTGFHGRSRSLRLRPDIALFVQCGSSQGLHLFDAKFRLEGTLDPDADTKYKNNDLHKMHAYRDGIPAARSAWVVYPGSKDEAWFDDGRRGLESVKGGVVQGVGALSVPPTGARAGLVGVLRVLFGENSGLG